MHGATCHLAIDHVGLPVATVVVFSASSYEQVNGFGEQVHVGTGRARHRNNAPEIEERERNELQQPSKN